MNNKKLYQWLFAFINGILYFVIALEGIKNIQRIFNFNHVLSLHLISLGAVVCYGAFSYKFVESMSFKPNTVLSWVLLFLSPFAASSFLSAGIQGATHLQMFDMRLCVVIGLTLFFSRILNLIDGSVKFSERLNMIKTSFAFGFHGKNSKAFIANIIILYTALGYALSSTDAIYTSATIISRWLGLTNIHYLHYVGVASSISGALAGFPMFLYWVQRGVMQLFCIKLTDKNHLVDQAEPIYTYCALIFSIPVIFGALGAATGSNPHVFGLLGTPADAVRVSSSILFAITASIPGLTTLLSSTQFILLIRRKNELDNC